MFHPDWLILRILRQSFEIERPKVHWSEVVVHLYFNIVSALVLTCILVSQNNHYSRGTKVEKMLTLAPERYTAGFRMVAKVILWCI